MQPSMASASQGDPERAAPQVTGQEAPGEEMQEDRAEPVKRSAPPREDEQVTKKSALEGETAPVPAPAAAAQGIPAEATYVLEQIPVR